MLAVDLRKGTRWLFEKLLIYVFGCVDLSCSLRDLSHVACKLWFVACEILFPDQESNWGPLHWEHRVLSTGPPGKSRNKLLTIFPLLFHIPLLTPNSTSVCPYLLFLASSWSNHFLSYSGTKLFLCFLTFVLGIATSFKSPFGYGSCIFLPIAITNTEINSLL